jgi:acetyltransferase-like isoleucine patch superfamily enzyme
VIRLVLEVLNKLAGFVLAMQTNVEIGKGSSVRWLRIGARGGRVRIGAQTIIHCRIAFDGPGVVAIGDRCYIGTSDLVCRKAITIGDDTIISWGVTIVDHDSHALDWRDRQDDVADWRKGHKQWGPVKIEPVELGNRVWVGFGATILKGVTVGDGAVVAAQSVVTQNVPPDVLVAGVPARIVRHINENGEA